MFRAIRPTLTQLMAAFIPTQFGARLEVSAHNHTLIHQRTMSGLKFVKGFVLCCTTCRRVCLKWMVSTSNKNTLMTWASA